MTPVLQPLDRMVNFPFKKYLKTKFSEYLMFANEKELFNIKLLNIKLNYFKSVFIHNKIYFCLAFLKVLGIITGEFP